VEPAESELLLVYPGILCTHPVQLNPCLFLLRPAAGPQEPIPIRLTGSDKMLTSVGAISFKEDFLEEYEIVTHFERIRNLCRSEVYVKYELDALSQASNVIFHFK
jgi:hypothetical protein